MLTSGRLTLDRVLSHRQEVNAGSTFLIWEARDRAWSELTYGAFAEQVSKTAAGLRDLGLRAGDRVAIHMANRPEFLVALLAALRLGAVAVPTIALYAPDELRYVLDHAEVSAIICDPPRQAVVEQASSDSVRPLISTAPGDELDGAWLPFSALAHEPGLEGPSPADPEDLALIMYSSGTTARPKGVMLNHNTLVYAGECNAQHQRLRPEDRTLCITPLFHVNAMFISTVPTLLTGSSEVLLEQFDLKRYWAQVRAYRATVGSLVANPIRRLLAEPELPSDGVHELRFMITGLPLREEEIEEFERRFRVPLVNVWGMTENAATGTRTPPYLPRKPQKVGLPMLGAEIVAIDEDGEEAPVGQPGEVRFRGGAVTDGYYRNEVATRDARDGDWFLTGDTMSVDEEGYFTFVDRKKDVIKVRGENVASSEVERVLSEHPGVEEVAVVGVPDPVRDEGIVACVVLKDHQAADEEELRDFCGRFLAHFKVPHEFRFVDELPKTSILKVQKGELRRQLMG